MFIIYMIWAQFVFLFCNAFDFFIGFFNDCWIYKHLFRDYYTCKLHFTGCADLKTKFSDLMNLCVSFFIHFAVAVALSQLSQLLKVLLHTDLRSLLIKEVN